MMHKITEQMEFHTSHRLHNASVCYKYLWNITQRMQI